MLRFACVRTDKRTQAHTSISSAAHSHLAVAVAIVCGDTDGIDFPWQRGPSIATNIGRRSHHVDTEHNHFCLSAFFPLHSSFPWHKGGKKEREGARKQGLRGCPAGYIASPPRFNVNLILSLAMVLSVPQTQRGEKRSCAIKGFHPHTQTHTCGRAHIKNRIKQMQGRPSQLRWRRLVRRRQRQHSDHQRGAPQLG